MFDCECGSSLDPVSVDLPGLLHCNACGQFFIFRTDERECPECGEVHILPDISHVSPTCPSCNQYGAGLRRTGESESFQCLICQAVVKIVIGEKNLFKLEIVSQPTDFDGTKAVTAEEIFAQLLFVFMAEEEEAGQEMRH